MGYLAFQSYIKIYSLYSQVYNVYVHCTNIPQNFIHTKYKKLEHVFIQVSKYVTFQIDFGKESN